MDDPPITHNDAHLQLEGEVLATTQELGLQPSGVYPTVTARLSAIETSVTASADLLSARVVGGVTAATTDASGNAHVNFGYTMDAVPIVVASTGDVVNGTVQIFHGSITTTGFDIHISDLAFNPLVSGSMWVNWIATCL
jgi:hypothetical protein